MAKSNGIEDVEPQSQGLTEFESRLLKVLGLMLVQERQQNEQIRLLGRAGFRPMEIAAMLGTTRNTVNVELSKQRR
ncbi:MAG TPA: hypothetical protein VKS79_19225, partial [Gemmataceae bacterium]|nr:hypothetical protein [Gemmataceae bacterium]